MPTRGSSRGSKVRASEAAGGIPSFAEVRRMAREDVDPAALPTAKLTAKQQEANILLGSAARHIMLYGGSRSGKTFLLVRAIVVRALKAANSRHAIFRHRRVHLKASVWADTFPKVMRLCFPLVAVHLDKTDLVARFANGSEIWFCGLDDKERSEKVLGQEFATLYFNECSQIAYGAVLTALTRLAQATVLALKVYYDCNPPGTAHWTAKLFVEGVDPGAKPPVKLAHPERYAALVMNPADNAENLPPEYIEELESLPEKQRQRFLLGRFVADLDNALWTYESFTRVSEEDLPDMQRILVSVDPSGASGPDDKRSDEIGIAAAGKGVDGRYYVLDDASLRGSPAQWARAAIRAYNEWRADKIVAESNFGGEMVRHTIRTEDSSVPVDVVHHSRGKVVRAEPISALYAKGEVRHVGIFADLEEQMVNMTTAGYMGERSPDRLDATVWALAELSQGADFRVYGSA